MRYAFYFAALMLLAFPLMGVESFSLNVADRQLRFCYLSPKKHKKSAQLLLLIGGRDWTAERTLERMRFSTLAEEHNIIVLAPYFHGKDYWEAELWSGEAVLRALAYLQQRYVVKEGVLIYGYSAGAQFVWSFVTHFPTRVKGWALHANGVWSMVGKEVKMGSAGLVTCGAKDRDRYVLSRYYVQRARLGGGKIAFAHTAAGHELQEQDVKLAEAFFSALLSSDSLSYAGDDQTFSFVRWEDRDRAMNYVYSYLPSLSFAEKWRGYQCNKKK